MRKMLYIAALLITATSCNKDDVCFEGTRVYLSEPNEHGARAIHQSFEDGTIAFLGWEGDTYEALDNSCEANIII